MATAATVAGSSEPSKGDACAWLMILLVNALDADDDADDGIGNAIGTGTACWIGVERLDDEDVDDVLWPFVLESLEETETEYR